MPSPLRCGISSARCSRDSSAAPRPSCRGSGLRRGTSGGERAEIGLARGHLKVLMLLSSGEALPMGSLAQGLSCDASTMTWLIDRLEERGLVERKMSASDRRVKTVVLTSSGLKKTAEVKKRLYKPPTELLDLDEETLEVLRTAFSAEAQEEKASAG